MAAGQVRSEVPFGKVNVKLDMSINCADGPRDHRLPSSQIRKVRLPSRIASAQ